MRDFIVTTGKGDVWIVRAPSSPQAVTKFQKRFPGAFIASVVESSGDV